MWPRADNVPGAPGCSTVPPAGSTQSPLKGLRAQREGSLRKKEPQCPMVEDCYSSRPQSPLRGLMWVLF